MNYLFERAASTASLWLSWTQLAVDTQSVVAMRLMGLGGAWLMPHGEGTAMIAEKIPAFTEAYKAGALSAMSGQRPEQIGQAALSPLSEIARNNRARLARCGPRVPGQRPGASQ